MFQRAIHIFILVLLFKKLSCTAQNNDTIPNYKFRKTFTSSSTIIAYTGSLFYLQQIWYKPYHTSNFHFFNDNNEWLLMDKCGHTFTAFYGTYYLNKLFHWSRYKYSDKLASAIAFTYLLNIEILDGFSSGWGFSWGDLTANTLGIALFYTHQQLQEKLFIPKFSFVQTPYPPLNPALLGNSLSEQILKDYNGQTYWISITPFYKWNEKLEWLCLSIGYSIDGVIGARSNSFYRNQIHYDYSNISRQTQWFLSIDLDFSKIKTKHKWINTFLHTINFIKIPAPALEWKGNNLYFRPLLFSN
ncbi:MAG: DUF2279 domain-containing protein [Bacteroidia bacterium]|nr:MAG: DUF2279 domain-containing protein [Bacteroidia bacterium]